MADGQTSNWSCCSAKMKVNRTIVWCVIWAGLFLTISSQVLSQSTSCDNVRCVEGSCENGTCRCNYGWKGENCDHCSGRVLMKDVTGFVTDGHGNYSVDNKCTWLLDTGQPNVSIQLKFHQFSTECGWDHVYVYDGDSVFSPLLAAYSGLIKQESMANASIPVITAKSGKAYIYFYSDAAYNMSGFNLSYSINTCPWGCSNKGDCVNRQCNCQPGYTGSHCEGSPCPSNCTNGVCVQNKCRCNAGYRGDDCSIHETHGMWERVSVPTLDIGLASLAATILDRDNHIYITGGYSFSPNPTFLSSYSPVSNMWMPLKPSGTVQPTPRYGHSLVGYQGRLYMYGGVVTQEDSHVTKKLYIYDVSTNVWDVSVVPDDKTIPVAVAGHTAHVVGGVMYVIFGHSPIYGYKNRVQEYNIANNTWKIPRTKGAIVQGGYGHASVYDPVTQMIYVYGGYLSDSHPNYQLTDQMYGFLPQQRKWIILRSNGIPRYLHSAAILNGTIFVFGGNTHNDTSISYGAKCYSPDFMVYNIECNSWYSIESSSLPDQGARYGHSAVFSVVDNLSRMYILGGFNGIMQNNIIRFTPGNCTAYTSKEACLAARQGVQCVWVTNSVCRSKSDAISDGLSNSSEHAQCKSDQDKDYLCPKFTSCPTCLSSAFNCQWCTNNCTAACPAKDASSLVREVTQCPTKYSKECDSIHNCFACVLTGDCKWSRKNKRCNVIDLSVDTPKDGDYSSETACSLPCYLYSDCENCTHSSCMWCANQHRCVETNSYVASFIYGQCMEWTTSESRCAATRCSDLLTCDKCQSNPMCGWCNDPTNTGIGKCMVGGAVGPGQDPLLANHTQCPHSRWFFTKCPVCQCNGHSTCNNVTGDCDNCQGMTTGEHCESCLDGYYGDPTNGGKCSACECNGQANTCDNRTGVCFCRTRGVVGDRCEKCDVPHKYYGDPKKGGTCYYDLVTDYQFTFNLSKRDDKYYTQINFMNIPSSSDRDVDFKVNCSGTALLNITIRTRGKNEHIFLDSYSCSYFREKFRHQEYSFGSETENTTFLVYVYDFQTPFWLQISFSQFPKIDLVHFFVTFFSCFLSLLIIASVLYKIKHKYDNYRRRQRMIVEMEEMASRPFSTVTLEIERRMENYTAEKKDPNLDLRKRKKINKPSQVALESLSTQKAAVLTLIVQLPTGDDDWTPSGSSGIAIASSLVTLGHNRKQSVEHGGKGDKNRFKKHSIPTHSDTCV